MMTISEAVKAYIADEKSAETHRGYLHDILKDDRFSEKEISLEQLMLWAEDEKWVSTHKNGRARVYAVKALIKFGNSKGLWKVSVPQNRMRPKVQRYRNPEREPLDKSAASEYLQSYIDYKRSADAMSDNTHQCLRFFNNYCRDNYPHDTPLSQEMINAWCSKRETENASSFNKRIAPIVTFLRYLYKTEKAEFILPQYLPEIKKKYVPHAFSKEELKEFFRLTDTVEWYYMHSEFAHEIRKRVIPVFYRLMYSTGMRTCEVVRLKCADVDLQTGVLEIERSKGYSQHRVALHRTMWDLMITYSQSMEKYFPDREYFFCNEFGQQIQRDWDSYTFNNLWKNVSKQRARAYDFRSNYAVENINKWKYTGPEWFDKLLYLSRTMGHSNISSTTYYYNMVPLFAEQLAELTEEDTLELLPDLTDYYSDEEDE